MKAAINNFIMLAAQDLQKALQEFVLWFPRVCLLDPVTFMSSLFELDRLAETFQEVCAP
jgi:hypothetical protein